MPKIELLNVDCMLYMATLPDKAFDLAVYGGFDFVGCELDKDYYDAACKRFKLMTAQQTLDL